MMDSALYPFTLPKPLQMTIEATRAMGAQSLRPLGISADRQGHPHPPDHPFYQQVAKMGFMERRLKLAGDVRKGEGENKPRWTARGAVAMLEEASYWDRGMAVSLPGPGLALPPVLTLGTPEQRERLLSPFMDRSKPRWAAFGMTEPSAGSDVARIATRCEKRGDRWVLNGEKAFCSNSPRADFIVIYATVDPAMGRAGHRAFAVPAGTEGMGPFRLEKKMGLVAYETATFPLQDCEVAADSLLGGEAAYEGKAGFVSAMKTFDISRPAIAAMAIGIGRAAYDHALAAYHDHFNAARPIGRYRRVAERLVTMKRKVDAGRLLCWKAAWLADHQKANTLQASQAKAYSAQVSFEACSLALEILGEAGVTRDGFLEKLFRDVKAMDIVEGTGQIQRLVIARRIVDFPKSAGPAKAER
jgi:acyl-CoA dehydrogenase